MKRIKALCLIVLVISLFTGGSALAFADEDGYLTKEYPFTAESEENLRYDVPEEISEEGKTYKLEDVKYEIQPSEDVVTVTREVTVKDPSEFKSEITETVEGKTYTLKAEEPKWEKKEVKQEEKPVETLTKEYPYGDSIPENVFDNGKTFNKQGEQTLSRTETWQAPANFATSDTTCKIYSFDGKLITIPGADPVWDGYTEDIKNYLGISGNDYAITSISWDGGFSGTDGNYTRTATVSGTRTVYYNSVTYTYQEETKTEYEYTAKVTYVDKNAENTAINAVAIAKYSEVKSFPVKAVAIGAGIAVLAAALSSVLYVLAKKKKKEEGQNAQ